MSSVTGRLANYERKTREPGPRKRIHKARNEDKQAVLQSERGKMQIDQHRRAGRRPARLHLVVAKTNFISN